MSDKAIRTALVAGYATVDYPARLPQPLSGAATATIEAIQVDRWPRPGGAALYAARRLAIAGHEAYACVTVGEDANGALYLDACREAGIRTGAIRRFKGVRTPWCMLLYHDNGQYTCLIDRGDVDAAMHSAADLNVAGIDLLCIAAGTPETNAALLSSTANEATVAWIAKRDRQSFPDWLTVELARRSDVIFCNSSERAAVEAARRNGARPNQIVIETRGAEGVRVEQGKLRFEVACDPLPVRDATGAGDTLAGEVLANLLSGKVSTGDSAGGLEFAVRRGVAAARELLQSRSAQ